MASLDEGTVCPHSLSIASGPVELTDGLVHVVGVAVVQAAAEPEPGVRRRSRVAGLRELKQGWHLLRYSGLRWWLGLGMRMWTQYFELTTTEGRTSETGSL